MSEIKFISENRDLLIEKIDFMQNKFTSLVSEITDELRDSVSMFTERINNKLKHIEGKFSVQQEELENLKKELKSKQFDESNFNNVSMIKNQSKQIAEKELRIKELESRNKYLEDNSKISKSTPIIGNNVKTNTGNVVSSNITSSRTTASLNNIENEVANQVASQIDDNAGVGEVINDDMAGANDDVEIEVSKDVKKIKGRSIKKKIIEVEVVENEPKTDVEEISKSVKKITKKPIKKQSDSQSDSHKESEKEAKKLEEERIRLENEDIERQRIADEEELRLAEEAEAQRLAEEAESKAKSKISKKTSDKPADKKITKKKIEKVIEIESEDEIPAPKVVDKKAEKVHETVQEKVHKPKEKVQEKVQKKEDKRLVVFPDCPPNDEDLEILELDGADYYKDTTNNNVYQIINGDDRGIFLGIYDENSNAIISP